MCGGRESGAWEEVADEAFTSQDLTESQFRERLVMTASYERYPPDEVAFDFVHTTNFGTHDFLRYLVLMIGDDPRVREQLAAAIQEELM